MTEGPYYLADEKLRRNITEGLPGAPLALRLTVLDASSCKPIKGAAVDIWHASAAAKYSGEESNGTVGRTYLRGIQRTDAKGLALFKTVYPGWYQGRAVHIHVIVHVGGNVVHTGQLFFRDSFTDAVYRRRALQGRAACATCATPTTPSTRGGGSRSLLRMRTAGKGYVGLDQHGRAPQLIATPAMASACWMPTMRYSGPCPRRCVSSAVSATVIAVCGVPASTRAVSVSRRVSRLLMTCGSRT